MFGGCFIKTIKPIKSRLSSSHHDALYMNVHHFRLWPHPAPLISWCVNVCARIPSRLSQRQSEEEGPRTEDALGHDSPVSVAVTSPGNMQVRRKSSFS